jgi:large subunit ribosomal protein L23
MDATYIIRKPHITEKSTAAMEHGIYTFEVDKRATKDEIKRAVEKIYKVKVSTIKTVTSSGRMRRYRYGFVDGKVSKRAMIRLEDGQTLELM